MRRLDVKKNEKEDEDTWGSLWTSSHLKKRRKEKKRNPKFDISDFPPTLFSLPMRPPLPLPLHLHLHLLFLDLEPPAANVEK